MQLLSVILTYCYDFTSPQLVFLQDLVGPITAAESSWGDGLSAAMSTIFLESQSILKANPSYNIRLAIMKSMGDQRQDARVLVSLQSEGAVKRYISHGIRLVASMIRLCCMPTTLPSFQNSFDVTLFPLVVKLHQELLTPTESIIPCLRELLLRMWRSTLPITTSDAFSGPAFYYTALLCIGDGRRFMAANDLSGIIAALSYWAKINVFLHLRDLLAAHTTWTSLEIGAGVSDFLLDFQDISNNGYGSLTVCCRHLLRHRSKSHVWDSPKSFGTKFGTPPPWLLLRAMAFAAELIFAFSRKLKK